MASRLTGLLESVIGRKLFSSTSGARAGNSNAVTNGVKLPGEILHFSGNLLGATFASQAGVGNGADTTEDTLFTYSLAPNLFDATDEAVNGTIIPPNRCLNILAFGTFANNTDSKTARLYFGSTAISTGAFATAALTPWLLEMNVLQVSQTVFQISGQSIIGTTHGGCTMQTDTTDNGANAIVIKATGQSAVATAGDIKLMGFIPFFSN